MVTDAGHSQSPPLLTYEIDCIAQSWGTKRPAVRERCISMGQASSVDRLARNFRIVMDRPHYPAFVEESDRLQTYCHFPAGCPVRPAALAEAGFFYSGVDDRVRCFYCNLGMHQWETGDAPWEQHACLSPRCNYLLSVKGRGYISETLSIYVGHAGTVAPTSAPPTQQAQTTAVTNSLLIWLAHEMNNPATKTMLEMGFSRTLVSTVLRKRYTAHRKGFSSAWDLFNAVSKTIDSRAVSLLGVLLQDQPDAGQNAMGTTWGGNHVGANEASANGGYADQTSKNERLKGQHTCKVCLDKEIQYVFLPCGHTICCSKCASILRKCGVCRSVVLGRVQIFLP